MPEILHRIVVWVLTWVLTVAVLHFALVLSASAEDQESKVSSLREGDQPVLLGVFDFPPEQADKWPIAVTRVSAAGLEASRAAGMRVLVALTGGRRNFSDSRGCFSLERWKRALDRHDPRAIARFVEDGTIVGLYAMDEPHDWECGPTFEEIDSACGYALSKWPNLPCGVNAPPGWLAHGRERLHHLGFLFTQYSLRRGDVQTWVDRQIADAGWFRGDLWLSIQVLKPEMSAKQFELAGVVLCKVAPRGVFLWKWSEAWFGQPAVRRSLEVVRKVCSTVIDK